MSTSPQQVLSCTAPIALLPAFLEQWRNRQCSHTSQNYSGLNCW